MRSLSISDETIFSEIKIWETFYDKYGDIHLKMSEDTAKNSCIKSINFDGQTKVYRTKIVAGYNPFPEHESKGYVPSEDKKIIPALYPEFRRELYVGWGSPVQYVSILK